MIKVDQTKIHSESTNGNCFAACLASILEIPLSDVPEFEDMGKEWFPNFYKWVEKKWLYALRLEKEFIFPGLYLVMGTSPRNKSINHQVIYKNGKMVHDPHPLREGVTEIKEVMLLVPLDPSWPSYLINGET